jgi:hypothetical protein
MVIDDDSPMGGADDDLQLSKLGIGREIGQCERTQQGVRGQRDGAREQQDRP